MAKCVKRVVFLQSDAAETEVPSGYQKIYAYFAKKPYSEGLIAVGS